MSIEELKAAIKTAKDAYLAKAAEAEHEWRALSDRLKSLQAQLHNAYADGAWPCKCCGNAPTGVERSITVGHQTIIQIYEIGCSITCTNPPAIVQDANRAECVAAWNERFGLAPEEMH